MTDVELTRALERGDIKDFHHVSLFARSLGLSCRILVGATGCREDAEYVAPIRRGRRQAAKISRDHHIVLAAASLTRTRSQPRRTPGRDRACEPAITGKGFSARLLFGRTAFQ